MKRIEEERGAHIAFELGRAKAPLEVSRKGWFAKMMDFVKAKTQAEANQTEIVLKLVFLAHGLHRLATP
jgi:hypothetical protein